jgi:hypothetical protein
VSIIKLLWQPFPSFVNLRGISISYPCMIGLFLGEAQIADNICRCRVRKRERRTQ